MKCTSLNDLQIYKDQPFLAFLFLVFSINYFFKYNICTLQEQNSIMKFYVYCMNNREKKVFTIMLLLTQNLLGDGMNNARS